MLEIQIKVEVDGMIYGKDIRLPTGLGANDTQKAIDELDTAVEKVKAAMRGNLNG